MHIIYLWQPFSLGSITAFTHPWPSHFRNMKDLELNHKTTPNQMPKSLKHNH